MSVVAEDGGFGVIKILAVDDHGVHVRLYAQRFPHRPQLADLGNLDIAPCGPDDANPFSIGHMPLSFQSFGPWRPQVVGAEDVQEDELEGYQMWLEANGGYF